MMIQYKNQKYGIKKDSYSRKIRWNHFIIGMTLMVLFGFFSCGAGVKKRSLKYPVTETNGFKIPTMREPRLSEKISTVLSTLSPDKQSTVLFTFKDQLDIPVLDEMFNQFHIEKKERQQMVLDALSRLSASSTLKLKPIFSTHNSQVTGYRSFTITNSFVLTAPKSILSHISNQEYIAKISHTLPPSKGKTVHIQRQMNQKTTSQKSWMLDALKVESLWEKGIDGKGVRVGIIDSGASAKHEQLSGGFCKGGRGWYAPMEPDRLPFDSALGHGTAVLSIAVGRPSKDVHLGVAKGAQWSACAGLPNGKFSEIYFLDCAEWILRVSRPHIVINAWAMKDKGCEKAIQRIVDTWLAAQIYPLFAAGNYGPLPSTDRSPANYAVLGSQGEKMAMSVGAADKNGIPIRASSRGPNSCWPDAPYPQILAPGSELLAAFPMKTNTYLSAKGTSYAVAVVGGAAALLMQAFPDALVSEVNRALLISADDRDIKNKKEATQPGLLNIHNALKALSHILSNAGFARNPT